MTEIPPDLEISMADIRAAGFCPRVRTFFRENGLEAELRIIVKGGTIPASTLVATGDPRAHQVVNRKLGHRHG